MKCWFTRSGIAWFPVGLAAAVIGAPVDPTLIVVVIVDQLRGDYLTAFGDHFVDGGFRRLSRDGAWFTQACLSYGATATGPGHASLLTGATPSAHGIVGNEWYATDNDGRWQYCCGDEGEIDLGYPPQHQNLGRSPRHLAIETLGDRLKVHSTRRSRVWSVSIKDRAAILAAGKLADGAVWWDAGSGNFVSTSFYGSGLPDWAARLNGSRFADCFFGQTWQRLLPESAYTVRFLEGHEGADKSVRFDRNQFPKILGRGLDGPQAAYYNALSASPFGNELVLEAARRIITEEDLGGDEDVDLLIVGLSSNDAVGHLFGPDSQEVMDCTLRTDRQLADFFDMLDRTVGLARCIIALSSDHGVGPVPEYASALGHGAGRIDSSKLTEAVEERLRRSLAVAGNETAFVRGVAFPWLYLDEKAVVRQGTSIDQAARLAADAARGFAGIAQAFSLSELRGAGPAPSSELLEQARRCYYPGRSGHVYLHWLRYWYKTDKTAGHGSAHDYDRHVPVMLMGPGIKPGLYARPVCPTGLVITLCRLLRLAPPEGATGECYEEVLAQPGR